MATVFKSEFLDKLEALAAEAEARGTARGEVEGRAQMILQVLAARGVTLPTELRDQVLACTDVAQLDEWGGKAATAQTIDEVFGEADGNRDRAGASPSGARRRGDRGAWPPRPSARRR